MGNFAQKVFLRNLDFKYRRVKNLERPLHICDVNFKSWNNEWIFFFWCITRWYLKLRFVSNNFWTKILKSSHCDTMLFAHILLQLTSEEIRTDFEQIKNIYRRSKEQNFKFVPSFVEILRSYSDFWFTNAILLKNTALSYCLVFFKNSS